MCSNCAGDYENPDATVALDDTAEERVAQLCKSAAASFYHTQLSQKIELELGELGEVDALQLLLRDEYYRRKFRLASRQL